MPNIRYDGRNVRISKEELDTLRTKIADAANAGRFEWVEIDPEEPSWLLVGPGIPVTFDQEDPPDLTVPEFPIFDR